MNDFLSWISDDSFITSADSLIFAASNAIQDSGQRLHRNVPDPFTTLVIASTLGIGESDTLRDVLALRSGLQGVSNAIGGFHQSVLSSVEGWENHDAGYDLENASLKTIAEVKNKHNTMNASNKEKVIQDLDIGLRQKGRGWTGYLVYVVPRSPERFNDPIASSRRIFEIDGASFYEIVTGRSSALHELYFALEKYLNQKRGISDEVKSLGSAWLKAYIPD